MRSAGCVVILSIYGKFTTKKSLKHSLLNPFSLFDFKTFLIAIGAPLWIMIIIFLGLSELPIVYTSICLNLGPLLTVILAVPILKEKLSNFNLIQAIFSLLGVMLIVYGSITEKKSSDGS